jgi:uncharacterized protein
VTDLSPAITATAAGTTVRVRAVPRAKVDRLDGLHGDALRVRIAAPPSDGRANDALLALLADALGVRRRDLVLVRGERSRDKTVRVTGLGPAAVATRLARATGR